MNYPFVDWDDPQYVRNNEGLRSFDLEQVSYEFQRSVAGNYHPITMLSYALDISFFGRQPGAMHGTNILLHLLNIILACVLALRLTRNPALALLSAALFAIHPLRVESVAWISARKDLLMFFFSMLSLLGYLRWLRSSSTGWLVASIAAFSLALLSKAVAVSLLPILFLVDHWSRGQWHLLWQWPVKLAFALPALAIGAATLITQNEALQQIDLSIQDRLVVGCRNLLIYAQRLLVPLDLSAYYPYPDLMGGTIPEQYLWTALLLPMLAILWWRAAPPFELTFCILFLFATLFPVLQFLPAGHAMQADRYTYLGGLAWALFTAILARYGWERWGQAGKITVGLLLTATMVLFIHGTRTRLAVWSDPVKLWDDMLSTEPKAPNMLVNRALTLNRLGDPDAALRDLDQAVELASPGDPAPLQFRARQHLAMKDVPTAERDLLRSSPPWPLDLSAPITYWHYSRGDCARVLLLASKALETAPTSSDLLNMSAYCHMVDGELEAARRALDISASNGTDYAEYWVLRALVELASGRPRTGCEHLTHSTQWIIRDTILEHERRISMGPGGVCWMAGL